MPVLVRTLVLGQGDLRSRATRQPTPHQLPQPGPLDAYAGAPAQDRAFGGVVGTRSVLAVARVFQGDIDGATDAPAPVLELPASQRIHGLVTSVEHVRTALRSVENSGREVTELAGAIEGWIAQRLTPPQ